jgi:PAS domain S-box-containing protein
MIAEAAPLSHGIVTSTYLIMAAVLGILAWKERNRGTKGILAFSMASALLLALARASAWRGTSSASFSLLAELAGLAAGLLCLARIPRWLATPTLPEAMAMKEEKEAALGRLHSSETHLGRLVEEVREYAICQLDVQGRVASWNLGAERIKGWRAEEILGQPNAIFYPEEEIRTGKPEQDLEQARTMGSLHQEVWRIRKDGSRFFASVVLTATHDTEGHVTGFTKITHDITDRREMEVHIQTTARDLEAQMASRTAELQESEARLQGFIQHAPAAIAFKDLNGHLLMVNRRAEALIGRSHAATPDKSLDEVFPPEVVAKIREQDERVVTLREEIQTEESVAFPGQGARDFLLQKFPLVDAIGHCWGLGAIATDITERKQDEQAHIQRQKLESLGLLAGGIAHDFNNLLGAMIGNLESARLELGPVGQASTQLQAQEKLITRASSLVAQILAYAGKGKIQVKRMDLNLQVEEMTRLLQSSLSGKGTLRWEPNPDLPPMEGDVGQINQVIMNLVLNATEAVDPQRGLITVRTANETLTQADIKKRYQGQALNPGPHLVLEVSDNGPGMPHEVQARIFDPFFTTKFTGRGLVPDDNE